MGQGQTTHASFPLLVGTPCLTSAPAIRLKHLHKSAPSKRAGSSDAYGLSRLRPDLRRQPDRRGPGLRRRWRRRLADRLALQRDPGAAPGSARLTRPHQPPVERPQQRRQDVHRQLADGEEDDDVVRENDRIWTRPYNRIFIREFGAIGRRGPVGRDTRRDRLPPAALRLQELSGVRRRQGDRAGRVACRRPPARGRVPPLARVPINRIIWDSESRHPGRPLAGGKPPYTCNSPNSRY